MYVLPATASDDAAEAVERIEHQIVTNDQADALTDAQRARGIQQMIDAGLTPTKVAKRLSVSRDTVKAATTATGSTAAMDALNAGQLSLVEAAALSEFDQDADAIQKLLNAAGGPMFDHTVAQLRQEREEAQARAEAAQSFAAQGYRVLNERPAWRDASCVELRWLRTAEGNEVTEEAITNPAHWAVWLEEDAAFVDRETGEPVDEDTIDFHTEHHANEQADEGLRRFSTVIEKTVYTPSWYCIDHEGAGLDLDGFLKNARPVVHGEGRSTSTDEDQDEARARREAEAAEAAKQGTAQGARAQQARRCRDRGAPRVRAQAAGQESTAQGRGHLRGRMPGTRQVPARPAPRRRHRRRTARCRRRQRRTQAGGQPGHRRGRPRPDHHPGAGPRVDGSPHPQGRLAHLSGRWMGQLGQAR